MITIPGIPGTMSPAVRNLRWFSVAPPSHLMEMGASYARAYIAYRDDGTLKVVVSRDPSEGGPKWHISISHADHNKKPDRLPTWDEMKHAKYNLVPDDIEMVLVFPKKPGADERYVDLHETTLHLWEN